MILQNIKSIVALILGAILVFLFMKNCSGNKQDEHTITTDDKTVVVKLTTHTDTLYKKQYVYIKVPMIVPGPTITDTLYVEGTKDVVKIPAIRRTYKDSTNILDSVQIGYKARVTGTLDDIQMTYKDRRAEKTIVRTNTTETTITNSIKPSGLYVGIGANLGLNSLTPSIEYLNNKNKFGVYYNVAGSQTPLQNVGITYSRKLF